MSDPITSAQVTAGVVAIVGAVRDRWPALPTLALLVVACAVGIGGAVLYLPGALLDEVRAGVLCGLAAAGGVHAVGYGAKRLGAAMGGAR